MPKIITCNDMLKSLLVSFQDNMNEVRALFYYAYDPILNLQFPGTPVESTMFFAWLTTQMLGLKVLMDADFTEFTTDAIDDLLEKDALVQENLKECKNSLIMDSDFYRWGTCDQITSQQPTNLFPVVPNI